MKNKVLFGLLLMSIFLISSLLVSAAVTVSSISPADQGYIYDQTAFSATVTTPENETVSTATLSFSEYSLDLTVTNSNNATDALSYTFGIGDGVPTGTYDAVLLVTTNNSNTATETLNYVVQVEQDDSGSGAIIQAGAHQTQKNNTLFFVIFAIGIVLLYYFMFGNKK